MTNAKGFSSTDELMPVREVASRLGCSPKTVRRWLREGLLSATRIHGRYYVCVRSLRELLDRDQYRPRAS